MQRRNVLEGYEGACGIEEQVLLKKNRSQGNWVAGIHGLAEDMNELQIPIPCSDANSWLGASEGACTIRLPFDGDIMSDSSMMILATKRTFVFPKQR